MVEHFNRTLISVLAYTVNDFQDDWDLPVKFVAYAYNCMEHVSTGITPNKLVFGKESCLATYLQFGVVNH